MEHIPSVLNEIHQQNISTHSGSLHTLRLIVFSHAQGQGSRQDTPHLQCSYGAAIGNRGHGTRQKTR